jgi:hypothetical protein
MPLFDWFRSDPWARIPPVPADDAQ